MQQHTIPTRSRSRGHKFVVFARINWETPSDLSRLKPSPTIDARVAGTKRSPLFSAHKSVLQAATHGHVHNFVVRVRISMKRSGIADTGRGSDFQWCPWRQTRGAVHATGISSARKHMFLLGHLLESTVSSKR